MENKFFINDYNIHNEDLYVINKFDTLNSNLNTFDYPMRFGKGFVSDFFRGRTITLEMLVKSDTQINFDNKLDEIRGNMFKDKAILKEIVNGEQREIEVVCVNMPLEKKSHNVTSLPFSVTYESLEPFWKASVANSGTISGVTADTTENINVLGNAPTEPYILYDFSSASGGTYIKVVVGNYIMQVNHVFADGDTLAIDSQNELILINGANSFDYTGRFPKIDNGDNTMSFFADGDYNVDITVSYNKKYK